MKPGGIRVAIAAGKMHKLIFAVLVIAVSFSFPPLTYSQSNDDSSARRTVTAVYTAVAPVIDGDLSDEVWYKASAQDDFRRRDDPDRGGPARVKTLFRILYDEEYLYIGLEMHGDNPDLLLKSITKRDENLDKDDSVCLYIDAFHDLRSAYFLQVNSLGIQRDLFSTGYGKQVDMGWDALWDAATGTLEDGWTVEFRIPFKIFRFNWSNKMTWGLEILRTSLQREEWSEWCYVEDTENNTLDPHDTGQKVAPS
ncbi:carbohydrate binding family 9 domain-containing protein, partial [candidate division CSSED10-310 bacterium]